MPEPSKTGFRAVLAEIDPVWKAIAVVVGAVSAGLVLSGVFGFGGVKKADFDSHVTEELQKHQVIDRREQRLEDGMNHLHEEQRGTRDDFRAIFPGRLQPLPAESPFMPATTSTRRP